MARTLAVALALLALTAGEAQSGVGELEVVVVPGLTLADLPQLAELGAVGLLVPGAGPETSEQLARAALVRGVARNSLRGEPPESPPLVEARSGALGSAEGPAVYVGLPAGGRQPNDERYPIVVVGRGFDGLVTSKSARIPGLVSVADVAPTALGDEEGLGWEPQEDAAAELAALDERIDANNELRLWAVLLACVLLVALALVRPQAAVPAVAAVLLTNAALGLAGVSAAWTILLALGLAVVAGGPLLARALDGPLSLGLGLAGVLAVYLLALGVDGPDVALSPFGPTQNARFFGLSNLLATFLLVPALAGAALLGSRRGWAGFAAVAVLALVTVAGSSFGADGGGAVVLAVGLVALALLTAPDRRRALVAAPLAVAALVALVLLVDLAAGTSSHVTRAVRDGPGELAGDLRDRVVLSYERVTADWYVALVVAALLVVFAVLVAGTLARRGLAKEAAVPLALAAAVIASLVVNDSPLEVLLVGGVAFLAVERGMLPARWPGRSPSRSSLSRFSSWRDAGAARPSRLFRRT